MMFKQHIKYTMTALLLVAGVSLSYVKAQNGPVQKALYDFVVPDDGTFKEAIAAAGDRSDMQKRFRIFIKKGTHVIPLSDTQTVKGNDGKDYPSPITRLFAPNVSIIGEDMTETVVTNHIPDIRIPSKWGPHNVLEGLRRCATLQLDTCCVNTYFQGLTIRNGLADNTGRGAALEDNGNKTICKDLGLHGYQDTYLSSNEQGRFYFEGGRLRGRTDFLCGKGDVYYNKVDLVMCGNGYLAVPSKPRKYGYVFKNCTIRGEKEDVAGRYTLGRPWGKGTPIALFIDTRMEVVPSVIGWSEMGQGWPARFAEYNSIDLNGRPVSTAGRKTVFTDTHTNNPVLTKEEAERHTLALVMGGDDGWNPTVYTVQAGKPVNVRLKNNRLTWNDDDRALCWAVCKDGSVTGFTTTNSYTVTDLNASYTVRAANYMGGLGEPSDAVTAR